MVNDRPVMIVETADGGADCVVLDWTSGSFVVDRSYFSRTLPGDFRDVDAVMPDQMTEIVAVHRARILRRLVERLAAMPIDDEGTGDQSGGQEVDVIAWLGLDPAIPPFDGDAMEPTVGPGLMVIAPRVLRRHLVDEVLGAPDLGAGPGDTVAASYRISPQAGDVGCVVLARYPTLAPDAEAVFVQFARSTG